MSVALLVRVTLARVPSRRTIPPLALTVVAAAIAVYVTGCGVAAPPRPFADTPAPGHEGARLVVVGDLQRTAPLLELWREQNDPERALIVRAIADAHPDLLAITGDCVFDGGSDGQWAAFDALVAPLHANHVPAIAAFGNHEYWSGRADAEAHLFPRFPLDAHRHWFAFAFGPLQIVVLDANQGRLAAGEWHAQVDWYASTLDGFDRDPAVRGVVVTFHEPPYTNSTVTGDEGYVQTDLVPPFARATKTLAMLNGHVHSYERFVRGGKVFVVSGGGGGPRARLATGADRRHPDDVFLGPSVRDFNFTVYTLTAAGVDAEVRGLAKGGSEVRVLDRFTIGWP
jgi:hypothetical protein